MDGRAGTRARRDVERLARRRLGPAAFATALQVELAQLVPHAAACVVTIDPTTLLLTGTYKFGDLAGRHDQDAVWANLEYGTEDRTAMVAIARQQVPAAAVSHLPGGVEDSPRARVLLPLAGFGDELRLVARVDDHCWGGVNLFRRADEDPFTDDEVHLLASLSSPVGAGLRAAVLAPVARDGVHGLRPGPAVLIVGADDRVQHVSVGTEELLHVLTADPNRSPASAVVHGLVAGARQLAAGTRDVPPATRLRLPTGRWLVGHAAPLASADGVTDQVVVTFEEARPPEILPLLVTAFGLTEREQEVTELVLQGHDTRAIADELRMSAYTVQDHLKAVFDKAGVRSRRQLMARVFFDHHGT